jgi:phosphonate transport system substrate-binding protein
MRAGEVDIAHTGSMAYLLAHEQAGAEAIAARGRADGTPGVYYSVLIANPHSDVRSLRDLEERSAELKIAFTDSASTSGYLIPFTFLEGIGLAPTRDFREVFFALSHLNAAMSVSSGKVDVAAMSASTLERLFREGQLSRQEVRLLWKSQAIPTGPVSVRGALPRSLRAEIQEAYVSMHVKRPAAFAKIRQILNSPEMIYLAVDDTRWEQLRARALEFGSLQLAENRRGISQKAALTLNAHPNPAVRQ